jgi:phospholipid/cholesterol/gamma-HCH transport system substrate-binding protein
MFLELDPGTDVDPASEDDEWDDGDTIPVANTAPDVPLDEVLEALDTDTRAYLRLLLVGGGEGLRGRGKDLGELLGSLGPVNRDLAKLNQEVAKRKENLARLIHNMNVLFETTGTQDDEIAALIDSSNSALSAIAGEDLDVRRATGELGPTLRETRIALEETGALAEILGPALNDLRPFARRLKPINDSLGRLARETTGDVKTRIRPFTRSARAPVRDLRPAAANLEAATPGLTVVGNKLNKLFNMAAYNPNGAEGCTGALPNPCAADRDEGYLYWLGWLGAVGNSTFSPQDAHGVYRKLYLTVTCDAAASIVANPLSALISGLPGIFGAGAPCGP